MSTKNTNSWVITGLSSIILGIISSAIYDFIKSKPILSSLMNILKNIWTFIIQILDVNIKLWLILVILILIKSLRFLIRQFQNNQIPITPSFSTYKSERFTNWLWKWDWKWNTNLKKWQIINLNPYCPDCDIELLDKSNMLMQHFVCPKCQKQYSDYNNNVDDLEGIKTIIYDNTNKKNY